MLTTPQRSVHLVVQSQFLNSMVLTQLLNTIFGLQILNTIVLPNFSPSWSDPIMVGPQLSAIEADNPTVWLHGPKSNPNWPVFQNLQILRTIASGHDDIHTPAPFSIWGLLWQLWLSYTLRTSVNCTQCLRTWTKSRIVQSPTKLNYKI